MSKNDLFLLKRFIRVNMLFFNNQFPFQNIFWSTGTLNITVSNRRKRCWGVYADGDIIICVSLKNRAPLYVLDYLIYHECLHHYWQSHGIRLKRAEWQFPHYPKAEAWLRNHENIKAGRH
jgi:hypothetical protein